MRKSKEHSNKPAASSVYMYCKMATKTRFEPGKWYVRISGDDDDEKEERAEATEHEGVPELGFGRLLLILRE